MHGLWDAIGCIIGLYRPKNARTIPQPLVTMQADQSISAPYPQRCKQCWKKSV